MPYEEAHERVKTLIASLGPFPSDKIAIPPGVERSKPLDEKAFKEKFKLTEPLPASNLEAEIDPKTRTLKDGQYAVNYLISDAARGDPALRRDEVKTAACYVENRKGSRYRISSMRLPEEAISNPTQTIKVNGTDVVMPSDAYLKYVDKQISSFIAEVGSHRTVYIQPSKDENLVKAYLLICQAKGLNYKVVDKKNQKLDVFTADSLELVAVNSKIDLDVLLPRPRVHAEVKKLIGELHNLTQGDPTTEALAKPLLEKIEKGKTPGPEEVDRIVQELDHNLQKKSPSAAMGPLHH